MTFPLAVCAGDNTADSPDPPNSSIGKYNDWSQSAKLKKSNEESSI